MSILVLGGAGYIGSHTALELIRTGESVIIADNLATGHIEAVPKDAKFYLGDLHDKAFLDNIFENEQIDAVIHFAAYSHPLCRELAGRREHGQSTQVLQ